MYDPRREHPGALPICSICELHSAVFSVTETHETKSHTRLLCTECMRHRGLLWERFSIVAHVMPLEHNDQAG